MKSEYNLSSIQGALIVEKMSLPTDQTLAWVQTLRIEAAKANLKPNQQLCAECGDIFFITPAPHKQEGRRKSQALIMSDWFEQLSAGLTEWDATYVVMRNESSRN